MRIALIPGDGIGREVAADFPDIQASHLYIDALAMQMVQAPASFDLIVTNNLFGDIITDLAAGLQGVWRLRGACDGRGIACRAPA